MLLGDATIIIPENLEDLLTPIALAYWIACDGSFNKRDSVVYIATHGFTKVEVEHLSKILLSLGLWIRRTGSTEGPG